MRYAGTLIAVRDLGRSRTFYRTVLGLEGKEDRDGNVVLPGGVVLRRTDPPGPDGGHGPSDGALWFEESDMDAFLERLHGLDGTEVREGPDGQRIAHLRDPDGHGIEVSEDMGSVVRRLLSDGLTAEQTAERMGVPLSYVWDRLTGW